MAHRCFKIYVAAALALSLLVPQASFAFGDTRSDNQQLLTTDTSSPGLLGATSGTYLDALTDRSNDIGVPSEGYEDSPYTVVRDIWPGTSVNARDTGGERNTGGTFTINKGTTNNTFTNDQYWDGRKPFRLTSANGDGTTGFTFYNYNDFALEDDNSVVPNAAIKFDNLTLYSGGFTTHNFYGRGNKFVIGENVTMYPTTGSLNPRDVEWRIYGGTEHNRDISGDGRPDVVTNVVLASGNWNYAFGGGEGATGTGTQLTIRDTANVANAYGGGERKGSVGVDEPIVNGAKGNPNNPGINVFVEGGQVGTLYGGSAINGKGWLTGDHPLVINEDIRVNVSGGYVGRIFGGDDTHDYGDGHAVDYSVLSDSPINGDVYVNLTAANVAGTVVGDINRNVPRAATNVRQVLGATKLNITADQQLDHMELFDFVNINGATVHMNNEVGFTTFDSDYSSTEGYIGQIGVTNGGRLELTKRAVINERYAHYNSSGSWQYDWIEPDKSLKATANHSAVFLRHGWVGESSEANRANSVLAIDGAGAGITAASGTAFNDATDVAGLLIHGSVGADTGWSMQGDAGAPGYSTLEVLGDPIYSSGDDYYYYVVADGSASNVAGTISKVPTSVNGGAAFKEPEGAPYVVCYRELTGGKIGWYLREKPAASAENHLVHAGDTTPVTAHVDMNGFAYEWAADSSNRMQVAVVKHTGAASSTDSTVTIAPSELANIATDSRFSNVTYNTDGSLAGFDVVIDQSAASEPVYYEVTVDFVGDDTRTAAKADCVRCVYDFVNTTDVSAADYQDSIMASTYGTAPPAGADQARLLLQVPYGCVAETFRVEAADATFTMTNETAPSQTRVAQLVPVADVRANYSSANAQTANKDFAVAVNGADLSSGVSLAGVTGATYYGCTLYSYKHVSAHQISNVLESIVQRDSADGIPDGIGEVASAGVADGLVVNMSLDNITRNGAAVGTTDPFAVNYGELRIRAIPPIQPVPTGFDASADPRALFGLGALLLAGAWLALSLFGARQQFALERKGVR